MGRSYSRARRRVLGGFALHRKAPVDRVPPSGLSTQAIRSWGAPHVFHRNVCFPSRDNWRRCGRTGCRCRIGYYSFVREFFEKPDAYEP
jgi:hypothetical protein